MGQLEIGDFRITLVRAGSYWWDGGAMYGVVPKTLWSKHHRCDELNRIEAGFNCFVIETDRHRVLVETGGGVRHDARARERMRLPEPETMTHALVRHGFEPDSIETVINTHLHWDHAGGNTVDDGGRARAALPRARYITHRGEVLRAREQHPRDAVSYLPVNYEPLIESGRMHLLDGDSEIFPGLELRVAPGHTRNMMVVIVRSGGQTWCQFADLVPFSAQIRPTWITAFDLFPMETYASKVELLRLAAAEEWWCSFAHDPQTDFAKIEEVEGKWRVRQSLP